MVVAKHAFMFRTPLVLQRVDEIVPEPYATLLHVHAAMRRVGREVLAGARIDDVEVVEGALTIAGHSVGASAHARLVAYLRGHLARVESPWLFPAPRDPARHVNVDMAKVYIGRAARGGK